MIQTSLAIGFIASFAHAAGAAADIADKSFFQPDKEVIYTPKEDGYTYEAVRFKSKDGTELAGWFIPGKPPVHGTVIHFHGNAGNVSKQYLLVNWLPAAGFNLFVFDYRGFGESSGTAERLGAYEDSVAAVEYMKTRKDIDANKIILFGQSIGAAYAMAVQGYNRFDGVVGVAEDSGFSSFHDEAKDQAGFLGAIVVADANSPLAAVPKISPVPLLIIHGTVDTIVPFYHAQRLFDAAGQPKELWKLEGANHMAALDKLRGKEEPLLLAKFLEWTGTKVEKTDPPALEPLPTIAPDSKDTASLVTRGQMEFDRKDLNGALADFNHALELDSKNAMAYAWRGRIRFSKNDLDGALADFNHAIELDPKSALAYRGRGAVKVNNGNLDGAINDLNQAIELDPNNAIAYLNRGIAKGKKTDYDGAFADYNRAIELDPKLAYAFDGRAGIKAKKGDMGGAIADRNRARELDPDLGE